MRNNWDLINQDSGEKTWLTPKHIIDALGHFDTDPCCPPDMPWRTADRMLTKADDGTTAPWTGRVWLNPPYGREAYPFLERMSRHQGGALRLCSSALTRSNGTAGFSHTPIPSCSFADESNSATRTARLATHAPSRPRSYLIHHPTPPRLPTAACAVRLCGFKTQLT